MDNETALATPILLPGQIKNDVLGGYDDYLFLHQGSHRQFDYLNGTLDPSPESVRAFSENIIDRRKFCQESGIAYIHLTYPSKPVVLREKLPENMREKIGGLFRRCYLPEIESRQLEGSFLYPEDTLKGCLAPFRLHDTHLSDEGHQAVVRDILQAFSLPNSLKSDLLRVRRGRSGDLSLMLKSDAKRPEIQARNTNKLLTYLHNVKALPGNTHTTVVAHNPRARTQHRLLAFGDSFLVGALHNLTEIFRDILFVRSAFLQKELVGLFGPSHIITSNAERYLASVQPDRQGDSVLLELYGEHTYSPSEAFKSAFRAQLSYVHYPERYNSWRRDLHSDIVDVGGIPARKSDNILVSDGRFRFESVGVDPQLHMSLRQDDVSRDLALNISIEIDRSDTVTLFLSDPNEFLPRYDPKHAIRKPVQEGINNLKFLLPKGSSNVDLRLDPAVNDACFNILDISCR